MRDALKKTLIGNTKLLVAAGAALVIAGAGGTTITLASAGAPSDDSGTSAEPTDSPEPTEAPESPDPSESPDAKDAPDTQSSPDVRPTDTHGYCVSQVAQVAPQAPTGSGSSKVNHGTLVSAAAHACGKTPPTAGAHGQSGKHGHGHGHGHSG